MRNNRATFQLAALRARRCSPAGRRPGEGGFTLIELLVAMFLLTIVLAVIAGALVDGFSSTNKQISVSKATQLVNRVTGRVATDLRAARAPDRTYEKIRETILLQDYMRDGTAIQDPESGANLQYLDDVLVATGERFRFYSDVETTAGPECVEYRVRTVTAGSLIERGVAPGPACGTFTWSVIQSASDEDVGFLFQYRLVCGFAGRGCGANCAPSNLMPSTPAGTLTQDQRKFISSVAVTVAAGFKRGGKWAGGGSGQASSEVSLRTRQNGDYRFAIGCEVAG